MRFRFIFPLMLVALAAACDSISREATAPSLAVISDSGLAPFHESHSPHVVRDRYLVRLQPNAEDAHQQSRKVMDGIPGAQLLAVYTGVKGFYASLTPAALQAIRHNPNVVDVEEDFYLLPVTDQTVDGSDLWGLDRIDQASGRDSVFHYDYNGSGVHIWIFDVGVDVVSELSGRTGSSPTHDGEAPWSPCTGHSHGTAVASVAAGSVHGVAKGATIHSIKVSESCEDSLTVGYAGWAFNYVKDNAARPAVINLSFAAPLNCGFFGCGNLYEDQIRNTINSGVVVVLAAGNTNTNACNSTPARVTQAITVGATNRSDQQAWFSSWGSCLDLYAPGDSIGISLIGGSYGLVSGTSIAAPFVTGVAATYLQEASWASPAAVWSAMYNRATKNALSNLGTGSPNVFLRSGSPGPVATITGPSTAGDATACTWYASGTFGTAPYSYQWSGVASGTGSELTSLINADGNLNLQITDALGRTSTTTRYIYLNQSVSYCY